MGGGIGTVRQADPAAGLTGPTRYHKNHHSTQDTTTGTMIMIPSFTFGAFNIGLWEQLEQDSKK